jgi:signal transduction histidine kinase
MVTSIDLRTVAPFSDLPDDQINWFLGHLQEVVLARGEVFVRQGDPPDWMFVLLEGSFQWTGEFGGNTVSLPAKAGEVSGVFPFSRMKRFTVTGRALSRGRVGRFPALQFTDLIQKMPELTTRLVALMSDRVREGTRIEQQHDRLASLGKLSAGLAHELNNPASAARRAAHQMREAVAKIRRATSQLSRQVLTSTDIERIEEAETSLLQIERPPLGGLALSDLEEALESVLRSYGHSDPWELSGALARCNVHPATLTCLLENLPRGAAPAALVRIAATAELSVLIDTIENSASRISNLVRTVRDYTHMDQPLSQDVDITRSLETTLLTLTHALSPAITVTRDYWPVPLIVRTSGAELNQVWTNLFLNAIEAMQNEGELQVRTFVQDENIVVEIGDNGPGIPTEIKPSIFDPFFTTKDIGEGTGLGLNTVLTIVRMIGGSIQVDSKPGDTRFQVWLPMPKQTDPASKLES